MREFYFQGGVMVPTRGTGATTLFYTTVNAVDEVDAWNKVEEQIDSRFGPGNWTWYIGEFAAFRNANGKGWDYKFGKNSTTERIDRRPKTAKSGIAEMLGVDEERVTVIG